VQGLADQRTQVIADAVLVPDGARQQALHAIGPGEPGVFSHLPAIFLRDLTEDGLQGEQGMVEGFGACKTGTQTFMQLAQAPRPAADLTKEVLGLLGCGRVGGLHAGLLSEGRRN
jgi:hypothetical protein